MSVHSRTRGQLLGRSSESRERAWDGFLAEYASLILQVVRLFERDPDRVDDCFVFACEQLRRDDVRRIRSFDVRGPASFPTWLRTVVRNLCLDWRRKRFGRPRPFRVIEQMAAPDQEVYRAIYLRGLTESAALEAVRLSFPEFTRAALVDSLARIGRTLSPHQSWLVASRHFRRVSLSHPGGNPDSGRELDPGDTRPGPEQNAAHEEQLRLLRRGLEALHPKERLLLRLRYEQDLTLEEVGRLTGVGSATTAQRAIERALEKLRWPMGELAGGSVSVKRE